MLGANSAVLMMVNNAEIVQCESQVKRNSTFVQMMFWGVLAVFGASPEYTRDRKRFYMYIYNYVIVIDQLPRFVCSIEAQIPRAKPEG